MCAGALHGHRVWGSEPKPWWRGQAEADEKSHLRKLASRRSATELRPPSGPLSEQLCRPSDIGFLEDVDRDVDLDTEVAYCALDHCVFQKQSHCFDVAHCRQTNADLLRRMPEIAGPGPV